MRSPRSRCDSSGTEWRVGACIDPRFPLPNGRTDPLEAFSRELRQVELRSPRIPVLSNVTGDWMTPANATDPAYWVRHVRAPVRFGDGLRAVLGEMAPVLLEVGPGQTLATLARANAMAGETLATFSVLPRDQAGSSDLECLLTALGGAWVAGADVDWGRLYAGQRRRLVSLPTYPFERQSFALDAPLPLTAETPARSSVHAEQASIDDWVYVPSWTRSTPSTHTELAQVKSGACWLVLIDDGHLAADLTGALDSYGAPRCPGQDGPVLARADGRRRALRRPPWRAR